jgi:hypothetical protein
MEPRLSRFAEHNADRLSGFCNDAVAGLAVIDGK